MSAVFEEIAESLIEGQSKKVRELVEKAIADGIEVKEILNRGLLAGMNEVGVLFQEGELFVPEVLIAAKAMKAGMDILEPFLKEEDILKKGKVVLATVKGDLHDIGIKLVGMMLEGAGFEVVYLGVDTSADTIIEAVKDKKPNIVGMAAMLTTTMGAMKDTIEVLKEAGLYNQIKVMVGGSPVSDRYANDIGAYYAADATSAVALANKLIG